MKGNGKIMYDQIFKQKVSPNLKVNFRGHHGWAENFPFMPKSLLAVSNDGHFYSAWSAEFLVKVRDPKGNYIRAFYHPYKKLELTRNAVLKWEKGNEIGESVVHNNVLPKTWPALRSMKTDNKNRIWVSTIVKNQKAYEWWVLNQKGKLLARFTWPRKKSIQVIKNGYIYVQENKNKTESPEVVRYRFNMKPYTN